MSNYVPSLDPNDTDCYFYVWCSRDGENTGSATDTGVLQGATITAHTVTPDAGLVLASSNRNAVTIRGITYAANTVVTAWFTAAAATVGADYSAICHVTLTDGRQLDMTIIIPVRQN
jgi:hypothetical protein